MPAQYLHGMMTSRSGQPNCSSGFLSVSEIHTIFRYRVESLQAMQIGVGMLFCQITNGLTVTAFSA